MVEDFVNFCGMIRVNLLQYIVYAFGITHLLPSGGIRRLVNWGFEEPESCWCLHDLGERLDSGWKRECAGPGE